MKVIFFDLDDTLLNSMEAEYNAICKFKRNNNFDNIESEEFWKTWRTSTRGQYDRYLKGEISFQEQRIRRIQELYTRYGRTLSIQDANEKFDEYLSIYEKEWMVFDDTIEVLEELSGKYKLGVITNGDEKQQRDKITHTGIIKYFDQIIISGEVGVAKPSKEIFDIACKRMNALPEECIMVGDKYEIDIMGAINAGLTAIWVNRNHRR